MHIQMPTRHRCSDESQIRFESKYGFSDYADECVCIAATRVYLKNGLIQVSVMSKSASRRVSGGLECDFSGIEMGRPTRTSECLKTWSLALREAQRDTERQVDLLAVHVLKALLIPRKPCSSFLYRGGILIPYRFAVRLNWAGMTATGRGRVITRR